jgi:DNA primase
VSANFIDFRALKQRVSILSVLDRYGIALRQVNSSSLRGKCPLPTHSSEQSKESFGVHVGKNIWACQSSSCSAARDGKKGGNVLDFVAVMESCSIREAAQKIGEWFGTSSSTATQKVVPTEKTKVGVDRKEGSDARDENTPLTFALSGIDSSHAYLLQRGITEEIARTFGVGFFPGKGSMSGRVVIPIHNERGELVAYAGRAIDVSEPKYKLPAGFKKSAVLFNLHRVLALESRQDVVIFVEGFFDCLKVAQSGFQNVVALMGSSLSDEQRKLLAPSGRVIVFLDGDSAGREGSMAIANQLVHSHFVRIVDLPDGKQPDAMSAEELHLALRSL